MVETNQPENSNAQIAEQIQVIAEKVWRELTEHSKPLPEGIDDYKQHLVGVYQKNHPWFNVSAEAVPDNPYAFKIVFTERNE